MREVSAVGKGGSSSGPDRDATDGVGEGWATARKVSRSCPVSPNALANNSTVSVWGARLMARSRSLTERVLIPARSARFSWVRFASRRYCLRSSLNVAGGVDIAAPIYLCEQDT